MVGSSYCANNAYVRSDEGSSRIVAVRAIEPGEEITNHYAIAEAGGVGFDCGCGSDRCLGRVPGDVTGLPPEEQKRLRPLLPEWFLRNHPMPPTIPVRSDAAALSVRGMRTCYGSRSTALPSAAGSAGRSIHLAIFVLERRDHRNGRLAVLPSEGTLHHNRRARCRCGDIADDTNRGGSLIAGSDEEPAIMRALPPASRDS